MNLFENPTVKCLPVIGKERYSLTYRIPNSEYNDKNLSNILINMIRLRKKKKEKETDRKNLRANI